MTCEALLIIWYIGKFWQKKTLVNHIDESYWRRKIGEYAKVNKYAKYSFAMFVNTGEENLDKAYRSSIFPPPRFSHLRRTTTYRK